LEGEIALAPLATPLIAETAYGEGEECESCILWPRISASSGQRSKVKFNYFLEKHS